VRKKTIQEPKRRALVFFSGVYFSFHGSLREFFTFEKNDECVNSLHHLIRRHLFLKVIQEGYDVSPWISMRFGTSDNHGLPFMKLNV